MTVDASNVTTTTITEDPATGDTVTVTNGVETSRIPPKAERVNERTIRSQANTALVNNRTYIAIASPSAAQTTAQVKDLSRQVNGLIRLVLNKLDGTD